MKKIFTVYCLILFLLGCQKNKELNGHWHLSKISQDLINDEIPANNRSELKNATLDLKDDKGIWNKNSSYFGEIPACIESKTNKLESSNGEYFLSIYKIEVKNDSLQLSNELGGIEFKGFKCEENCCDKQKDEFLNSKLNIDLPLTIDTSTSKIYNLYPVYEMRFFIGSPIDSWETECSTAPRIYIKDKYISLNEIPLLIAKNNIKIPISSRNQINYSIYADKNVRLEYIIDLIKELNKYGVKNFLLAVREDTDLNVEFKLRLRKFTIEDLDLVQNETTLKEYIK